MSKKIAIYSLTRGKKDELPLLDSFKKIKKFKDVDMELFVEENNTKGLSTMYNKFLDNNINNYDYILFVHDDVYIDDYGVYDKLIFAHEITGFDIVGLAGGLNPKITKPALWHLMCGGFNGGNLRGAVAHPASPSQIFMTTFGPTPSRVAILDGVFLSVKTESIKKVNWKFNENYTFHHYDIASCIDANNQKLKLGTFPIWIIHHSPGLLNPDDETFLSSQEKFIKEYSA